MTQVKNMYQSICIIQCYASACDKDNAAVNKVYCDFEKALMKVKHNESVFVMEDFNVTVGNLPEKSAVGPHGLGSHNDRETNFSTGAS